VNLTQIESTELPCHRPISRSKVISFESLAHTHTHTAGWLRYPEHKVVGHRIFKLLYRVRAGENMMIYAGKYEQIVVAIMHHKLG